MTARSLSAIRRQVYRIVGIAEDISKQKMTEEQLRAATVMLSSLIDHLQSGVLVEVEGRRITHVNQPLNDMFGIPISPQSLFGVDSRLLFLQPTHFASRIEEIIKAGKTVFIFPRSKGLKPDQSWVTFAEIRQALLLARVTQNYLSGTLFFAGSRRHLS